MRDLRVLMLALPMALAGCVTGEPTDGPTFAIIDTAGRTIGSARMWETPGGVTFRIAASGLPHGLHGIHVHAVGRCDPAKFTTAGPHWSPVTRQHGFNNPQGPHAGDLPNVSVASNGVLNEAVTLPGASFAGLMDADGSALVIHAAQDDYRTDPSGNSGDRIACGIVTTVVPAGR